MRGRIRRRLALAIVLTALIPVCAAIWLSRSMLRQSTARFFLPEIGQRLSQSLELYQDLAAAVKARMRAEAEAMAAAPALRDAVRARNPEQLAQVLHAELERRPELASLSVRDSNEVELARTHRGRPIDPDHELQLQVYQDVTDDAVLEAVFATDRARFEELEGMSGFVDAYSQVEQRRETDEQTYVYAFAALLGITIVAAVGVGSSLARGVSTRLARLVAATEQVGAGDLSLRVVVSGQDEISELARAFNHMLGEIETNRSRIEYLQQLATWQGMARRLAHEIKNPLTPIQLAVQEIHQRYTGSDPAYRQVVNTTLEVVEAEVGTLRRLVSEFSDFARLPKAKVSADDLVSFLQTQRDQRLLGGAPLSGAPPSDFPPSDSSSSDPSLSNPSLSPPPQGNARLEFLLPTSVAAPVRLDRQMFRRVLINLINNANRAIQLSAPFQPQRAASQEPLIQLLLEPPAGKWLHLHVDDNGPGIPEALRPTIFDPYVTHTAGGTGLGLAIVKKIVIEHGGTIEVDSSPLGGARISIVLPFDDSGEERSLPRERAEPGVEAPPAPITETE
jgi:two-component system, NtrC family, nitrogen regulation sensor histidine kinase NtrY